jgi:Raf kinase inhibitor-like YbhB/YbcL family protein
MCPFNQTRPSLLFCNVLHAVRRSGRPAIRFCCVFLLACLLAPAVSCGSSARPLAQRHDASSSAFQVESAAFKEGSSIPVRFSCEGENISPPLTWTHAPAGTRSFALIVDDPDAPAGVWTHWVVYNLPAQTKSMDVNAPKQAELAGGGLQGLSSFGGVGYGGPCPPPGNAHRYFFRLYALDAVLDLQPGAGKQEVLDAMKGHMLGQAELMGRFKR